MTVIDMSFFIGVCFAMIIAVVIGAVSIVYMIHGILSIIKDMWRLKAYRHDPGIEMWLGTQGTGMSRHYCSRLQNDK